MNLTHIPFAHFDKKPWKNGLGTTHDIVLAPEGADHSTFDVRCALSPIVEDNVFSSFPGVERVITPIAGAGLDLEFEDSRVRLACCESYRFDSGLSPMGRLLDDPVTVVNVMARTGVWRIERCEIVSSFQQDVASEDLVFVFALGDTMVRSEAGQVSLAKHDALLAHGKGTVQWDENVLFAHLSLMR